MTEFDIQESLFNRFKTLNEFSEIDFLETDGEGNYTNVHFPNIPFESPESKRYFELTFRSNEPEPVSVGEDAQNEYTGVLYIDIITPQDTGESEARTKYEWISRLFTRDIYFDDVAIIKCYVSTKGNEADHYRLQCAIEWEAVIDKE